MKKFLKKLFSKDEDDMEIAGLPQDEKATFILKVEDIDLGILKSENGEWIFMYTDDFKKYGEKYTTIVGFPDVDKIYRSEMLWPFFRIRIPGLKQPAIQEILEKEKINEQNEVQLLKRFGKKTIANPYQLLSA